MSDTKPTGDWWCANCKRALDGSHVTFEERCDECGHSVEWCIDLASKDAEIAALSEKLAAADASATELGDAYLRLRELLGPDSFRTAYGGTDRFEVTENAARSLKSRAESAERRAAEAERRASSEREALKSRMDLFDASLTRAERAESEAATLREANAVQARTMERLRAALRPFTRDAGAFEGLFEDELLAVVGEETLLDALTVGDFRRAAQALNPEEGA